MLKRLTTVNLLAALAMLLVSCAPAPPAPAKDAAPAKPAEASKPAEAAKPAAPAAAPAAPAAAKSGAPKRVFIGQSNRLESPNPYFHSDTPLYPLFCEVLGCLMSYDPAKGEPLPQLAESWKVENPTTWVFNLKKGVKWHDGSAFTAADVVHSLQRVLDDPTSRQKYRLSTVAKFEAADEHTVRITTKEPTAELPDEVFIQGIAMTSKAQWDKAQDFTKTLAMGTGPYRLKEWVPMQRAVLEKVPNWWGGAVDGPDEVIFQYIPEQTARVTALLNNEVQLAEGIPPQDFDRVNNASNVSVAVGGSITIMFLGMNPAYAPWDNKLVRQAVAHAVDRDAIIKSVLLGYAERLDGPIGPGQYAYDPNLQPKYTYDPEKAKKLLAEAGFPNGIDVELTTTVGRYIKDKEVAEAIAGQLRQVGIRANLLTPENAKRSADFEAGKLSFYTQGRGSVRDPGGPLAQYFQTGVTKRLSYSNPKVDELFKKQRAAFDPAERKRVLSEVMSLITEEAPAHFLWRQKILWGVAKNLEWQPRNDEAMLPSELKLK